MNIDDVIKVCGALPQAPQNISNGNIKGNGFPILAILLIGGVGYLLYREWKRSQDFKKIKIQMQLKS